MRVVLLSVAAASAALLIPASPAAALDPVALGFMAENASHSVKVHRGFDRGDRDRRDRRDRRRDRDFGTVFLDLEYQGDSAWRSDSFNDWWHDQPHRSQPRWVMRNRDCERQYWSGDSLGC